MPIHPVPTRGFELGGRSFQMVDLAMAVRALGASIADMPYTIRVFAENILRAHHLRGPCAVSDEEIHNVIDWAGSVGEDVSLFVPRVILPDSSGVPVLQDLAALREAVADAGGDSERVDLAVPLDFVIDHSLQVDYWGAPDAVDRNMSREFERNGERYEFLRWCQANFSGITMYPPGSGIIHQVNLERAARVVCISDECGETWVYPDFVIGGDSHTPMVNALGVLGWGVGGIDAEAALLGLAYVFPIPEVVGVRLEGVFPPGVYTTDLVLLITQRLRKEGVVNCAVEYFGAAVARLSVPERATLANMAPEYGATCGFFAIDEATLEYLRMTGRGEAHVALVERYAKLAGLFRGPDAPAPRYSRVITIDLAQASPTIAGPTRPQDGMRLGELAPDFRRRLTLPLTEGGFVRRSGDRSESSDGTRDGVLAIAAITSCTNTSNPSVMLAAGLVARNCVRRGLKPPPWVKTSLAPGSQAVTRYLEATGLLDPLRSLGFELVGYGCTTCAGKSGALEPQLAARIEKDGIVAAAVLSGNRNFSGRIHKLVQANYLMAPPLVVAYAIAGRVDFDPEADPLGTDAQGRPVYLRDLLPSDAEVEGLLSRVWDAAFYAQAKAIGPYTEDYWRSDGGPKASAFPWNPQSTYLVKPPFFDAARQHSSAGLEALSDSLRNARVLALLGSSVTTDHISPGGEIPADAPSGRYLAEHGVAQKDFNTYVGRRGNHHVMVRGTFANIRLRNQLTPTLEGSWTLQLPERKVVAIFEAAAHYRERGIGAIVIAGADYGTGSSRDWAAKGTALLGVKAVIAESYERIHRANLIGMGVVPLAFGSGQNWRSLHLQGDEEYRFQGIEEGVMEGRPIRVTAVGQSRDIEFEVIAQVFTESQRRLLVAGGMPSQVVHQFAGS